MYRFATQQRELVFGKVPVQQRQGNAMKGQGPMPQTRGIPICRAMEMISSAEKVLPIMITPLQALRGGTG